LVACFFDFFRKNQKNRQPNKIFFCLTGLSRTYDTPSIQCPKFSGVSTPTLSRTDGRG